MLLYDALKRVNATHQGVRGFEHALAAVAAKQGKGYRRTLRRGKLVAGMRPYDSRMLAEYDAWIDTLVAQVPDRVAHTTVRADDVVVPTTSVHADFALPVLATCTPGCRLVNMRARAVALRLPERRNVAPQA